MLQKLIQAIMILVVISTIALIVIWLFIRIEPLTNDDAYVYYNYARNFVKGRLFAYDTRNIPSEGFTSLLYLLLLVPFEALSINMTFASTIINIVALFGTVLLALWIVSQADILRRYTVVLYGLVCLILLTTDNNIVGMIGWGLETMLGPLAILAAAACLAFTCQPHRRPETRSRAITGFFTLVFVCYLVRPEDMVFVLGVGGLILLRCYHNRRETLIKGLAFAGAFAVYHIGKLAIFGDIFPTGFYRKLLAGTGISYVLTGILAYDKHLLVLGGIAIPVVGASIRRRRWGLLHQQWLWLLAGVRGKPGDITLLHANRTARR